MDDIRTVQVRKNNKWFKINFKDLKEGDVFRLFESDGNIVMSRNTSVFTALSDAYINGNKWTINIK